MVAQGYTATLVAATLAISRSSLYYQKKPRGSRADRRYDEEIVMACGRSWRTAIARGVVAQAEERAAGESQTGCYA